jgi:hypothetical protein
MNNNCEHKRVYGHGITKNIKQLEADGWEMCGIENNPGDQPWFWFKRRAPISDDAISDDVARRNYGIT